MQVAVLGTGVMGSGMARAVRAAGLDVHVWNRTKAKATPLADDGIVVADTVSDAVAAADVVITMVFDTSAVLGIADELLGALGSGSVWLQCSTVGPAGAAAIASAAAGRALVDAPVVGTKEPAARGTLTVLVSGDRAVIERTRPVLDAIGSKTVHVGGDIGQASALKLAANAWIAAITAATAQSLALASSLDLDGALFLETIRDSPTDSPYVQLKGAAMTRGEFPASFAVDSLVKDMDLMRAATEHTAFAPSLLEPLHALYQAASRAGHGGDDIAAVRTVFGS